MELRERLDSSGGSCGQEKPSGSRRHSLAADAQSPSLDIGNKVVCCHFLGSGVAIPPKTERRKKHGRPGRDDTRKHESPRKKQILTPFKKPNGVRNDIFRVFAAGVTPCPGGNWSSTSTGVCGVRSGSAGIQRETVARQRVETRSIRSSASSSRLRALTSEKRR